MFSETLPLAESALHPDWPQARFNVSGMFVHDKWLLRFINIMQQGLDCRVPVEAVHGAPAVLWNAGRPSYARLGQAAISDSIERFNTRNIGVYVTLTSDQLSAADLKDPLGNYILDCLAKRSDLNGVIINSDLLSKYIAEKHAALPQVASILKVTFEKGRGRVDYYHELGQRFRRYVVHPDDCRNLGLLNQLDREKAEIIVNENCAIHCANRATHYHTEATHQRQITGQQDAGLDPFRLNAERQVLEQELARLTAECRAPNYLPQLKLHKRNCNLSQSEMKAIYDLGFRHFKIQGRGDHVALFMYDVTRFLLEPEYVAPLLYKLMCRDITAVEDPI